MCSQERGHLEKLLAVCTSSGVVAAPPDAATAPARGKKRKAGKGQAAVVGAAQQNGHAAVPEEAETAKVKRKRKQTKPAAPVLP